MCKRLPLLATMRLRIFLMLLQKVNLFACRTKISMMQNMTCFLVRLHRCFCLTVKADWFWWRQPGGFLLPTARNLFSIRGSILLCVIWYRARGCGARLSSKADAWFQLVHFMRIAKQTSVTANGQIRNGRINGRWTSRNRQVSLISSSRASLSSSNIGFRLMVQRRSSWREFFRTDGFQ